MQGIDWDGLRYLGAAGISALAVQRVDVLTRFGRALPLMFCCFALLMLGCSPKARLATDCSSMTFTFEGDDFDSYRNSGSLEIWNADTSGSVLRFSITGYGVTVEPEKGQSTGPNDRVTVSVQCGAPDWLAQGGSGGYIKVKTSQDEYIIPVSITVNKPRKIIIE